MALDIGRHLPCLYLSPNPGGWGPCTHVPGHKQVLRTFLNAGSVKTASRKQAFPSTSWETLRVTRHHSKRHVWLIYLTLPAAVPRVSELLPF